MAQNIILGIVQGLCEFLPISSSGHLVLLQRIFGMPETGILVEILLHVGTLLAVLVVFHQDFFNMLRRPFTSKTVRLLIVATLPTVVVAVLFEDLLEKAFGGWFLGVSFMITAVILFASDYLARRATNKMHRKDTVEHMRYPQALAMGVAQAVAVVPGISRSGTTIVGGLAAGVSRQTAAKFSFLMSAIATLGSLVFKARDLLSLDGIVFEGGWAAMIAGMIASAVVGYLAIRWMLRLITRISLKWFGLYAGCIGVIVLLDQLFFGVVFEKIL